MITFSLPYLFLLLPLPWLILKLIAKIAPASKGCNSAPLKMADPSDFADYKRPFTQTKPSLKTVLASLVWISLLTAAARPQWIGDSIAIPQSGRDLMLAVDLSGSMQIQDFEIRGKHIDRLTALKLIAGDFIERRKGDRVGLILFGSNAYLQAPLTFDTATVKQLLMEAEVGLAGKETAIGDAIGLALKHLHPSKKEPDKKEKDSNQERSVLILLTDGINNAGELTPEKAAQIAARSSLKIHTVAIGASKMTIQTFFGPQQINPSADIDEKALSQVAEITGGRYFRAHHTQELAQIYQAIDQLEPVETAQHHFRPVDEMYMWPLLVAFAALLCLVWL